MRFADHLRLGIGFKLGLLLAAFGILSTTLTGYYFYSSSRSMLIRAAERDLLTATQVVGRNMKIIIGVIAEDAQLLAAFPLAANVFISPDNLDVENDKKLLADTFAAMLSAHPEYFQIRLIRANRSGLELVRVERDSKALIRVQEGALQKKARYPYVTEALRLARGDIYLSDITINHEMGSHSGLDKPTVTVSTPVISSNGKMLGLIVISIDLNGLSRILKMNLPSAYQLYLCNQKGDFLIHPDASQTFGFDRGKRILVQDTFKPVAALIHGNNLNVVMNAETGLKQLGGQVAAFVRLPFGDTIEKRFVILGLSQPLDNITRETAKLRRDTLQLILAFSGFALILSALVSRIVTGPLNTVVGAINRFSKEQIISSLPLKRKDELGLLSRSFYDMQSQIMAHLAELNESKKALDHLARHDSLTGLPNRRMFFDRLEHSIANSRRTGKQLAVLFVDLDRFKEINDTLGHAIGDAVLIAVADHLKSAVREVDTVARLGGDEFVILLDMVNDIQNVKMVVHKLHERFQKALLIDGHELYARASIGVSIFPRDGKDAEELMHNADLAMYSSKKEGRNAFNFHANEPEQDI